MSITVPIAEWLEGHAGKQWVTGSIPGGGINHDFDFFAYGTLFKSRQMISSMTFIQINWCTEIDLIFKQIRWRFI